MSCDRPFTRVHVNYLGQVILCNNDWRHEYVAGDLNVQDIKEVFNAPLFTETYRPMLLKCRRDLPLCEKCDAGVPWVKTPPLFPASRKAKARHYLRKVRKRAYSVVRALRGKLGLGR